jgi:hypothetical protein
LHENSVGILSRFNDLLLRLALEFAEFATCGLDDTLFNRHIRKTMIGDDNSEFLVQDYNLS